MPTPLLVLSQLHLELHPPLWDHLLIQGPLDLLPLLLDLDLLLALELLLVVLDQLDQMPLPMMPLRHAGYPGYAATYATHTYAYVDSPT